MGFVVALFMVVNGTRDDTGSGGSGATPAASASPTPGKKQKARKVRKIYKVKPGDTPSSIAVKTPCRYSPDPAPRPQPRRPDAVRRAEDRLSPVSPRVLAACSAAVLMLVVAPVARAAAPASTTASSAIVIEASTADVAYAKQPDRRRAIASTTKLMTALLTLERSRPSTVYRAVRCPRAPRRVADGACSRGRR